MVCRQDADQRGNIFGGAVAQNSIWAGIRSAFGRCPAFSVFLSGVLILAPARARKMKAITGLIVLALASTAVGEDSEERKRASAEVRKMRSVATFTSRFSPTNFGGFGCPFRFLPMEQHQQG